MKILKILLIAFFVILLITSLILNHNIPSFLFNYSLKSNIGNVTNMEQKIIYNPDGTKIQAFLTRGSGYKVLIIPSTMFGTEYLVDFVNLHLDIIQQKYALVILYNQPNQGLSTGYQSTQSMIQSLTTITEVFAISGKTQVVGTSSGAIPILDATRQDIDYEVINPMPTSSQLGISFLSGYFDETLKDHISRELIYTLKIILSAFPSTTNNRPLS
jgi:hypothetical protein